jgi:glycosyltransferase 2 family protein
LKSKIINIIKYSLFSGTAILLLYLVFRGQDFVKIGHELAKANYYWVGLSLVLAILANIVRAYRWNLLIEPLGYKPSIVNSFFAVSLGYFANIAIPRLGELSRCGALNKSDKVPVDKLFATVIIERSVDLLSLVTLMGLLFLLKFSFFGNFFEKVVLNPLYQKFDIHHVSSVVVAFVVIFFCSLVFLVIYFKAFLKSIKLVVKAYNFGKGILEGIFSVRKMQQKWMFVFTSILIWFIYLLMTYVVFFSIPATSNLSLVDAMFILVAGGLGQAAPVQNGFGVYHGIVASALLLYGISFDNGLLFAIIGHESSTLFMILFGVLAMIYFFFIQRNKMQNDPA